MLLLLPLSTWKVWCSSSDTSDTIWLLKKCEDRWDLPNWHFVSHSSNTYDLIKIPCSCLPSEHLSFRHVLLLSAMTDYTIFVSPHQNRKFDQSRLWATQNGSKLVWMVFYARWWSRMAEAAKFCPANWNHPSDADQQCLNASEVNNIEGPVQGWLHWKWHVSSESCDFRVLLLLPHSHAHDSYFSSLYSELTVKYCQPDRQVGFKPVCEENVFVLESCIHQQG